LSSDLTMFIRFLSTLCAIRFYLCVFELEKKTGHDKKDDGGRRRDCSRHRDTGCTRGVISIAIPARSLTFNSTVLGSKCRPKDTDVVVVQLLLTSVGFGVANIVALGEILANITRGSVASIEGGKILIKVVVREAFVAGDSDGAVVLGIVEVFLRITVDSGRQRIVAGDTVLGEDHQCAGEK
jgi:hypothetical protein